MSGRKREVTTRSLGALSGSAADESAAAAAAAPGAASSLIQNHPHHHPSRAMVGLHVTLCVLGIYGWTRWNRAYVLGYAIIQVGNGIREKGGHGKHGDRGPPRQRGQNKKQRSKGTSLLDFERLLFVLVFVVYSLFASPSLTTTHPDEPPGANKRRQSNQYKPARTFTLPSLFFLFSLLD